MLNHSAKLIIFQKISTRVNQGQTSRLGKKFWIVAVSNGDGIISQTYKHF